MPRSLRSLTWMLVAAGVLAGCRPADAPKEPTEPTEPTVSRGTPTPSTGGVAVAIARRGQALAKL